jgi:hypothetical protein
MLTPAMTTVVGIFGNARDLDKAVERLARAGFEDAVYDEGIVTEEAGNIGPIFAPGSGPPATPIHLRHENPWKPI